MGSQPFQFNKPEIIMSSPISFSPKSNYEKVLSALPPKYILNCYFSFPPITIIFGGQKQVWTVARTGAPIQSTSHSTAWAILKHILDHTIPILNPLQWLPIALQMNPSSFPWSTGPAWPRLLFPQYHPFLLPLLLCFIQCSFILQPKIPPLSSFAYTFSLYSSGIN